MIKYGKVWGENHPILEHPNVHVSRINVKKGYKCSEHCHRHRHNMFYVCEGRISIHTRKSDYNLTDETILGPHEVTSVPPGEYHWFESLEDSVVLEIYYVDPVDSRDIDRVDVGGEK